ncbi:phage tail spike protein [Marinilactibacillus sp. Marseille-P9653]|uniref:phage tail spike protein n=1 Tax=Marinilactibacillus sp. Marseille-P9653 TaxID=2866583 RepID=UPI001CE3FF6C|nr:phage tail spike protein [Marinilactibacillus sp. Marseille-P9653]
MIPILFKKDEKQFRTYGIGELSDFTLSPEVRRERNGLYTFYMEYAPDGVLADQLDEGMKIKSDAGVRTKWQTFEINRVVKRSGENIQVYANHISMRTAKDVIKPKVSGSNLDGQGLLRLWANNLVGDDQWDVWSDVSTQVSVNWSIEDFDNAREVLGGREGSILDRIGGEFEFDNQMIRLHKEMGRNAPIVLEYGRNIISIEKEDQNESKYTAIYPFATFTPENRDTTQIVSLPEYYIDSKYAGMYDHRKIQLVDFTSEFDNDNKPTVTKVRELAKKYIESNEVGAPHTNIKVEYVDLAKTLDYEQFEYMEEVELNDRLPIYYPKFDITNNQAKAVVIVYDPIKEENKSVELGVIGQRFGQVLTGNTTERLNKIEKEQKNQMLYVINAAGNRVWYSTPPEDMEHKIGDVWFDENGTHTLLKVWDGSQWIVKINTEDVDKVKREVEAVIEDAETDRKNTQEAIEQVLVDAEQYTNQKSQEFEIEFNSELDKVRNIAVTAPQQIEDAIQRAGFGGTLADLTDRIIQQSNTADQTAREAYNKALDSFNETGKLDTKINGVDQKVDEVNGSIRNRVWQTDITNAIDGIEVDSRNLVIRHDEVPGWLVSDGVLQPNHEMRTIKSVISVVPGETLMFTKTSVTGDNYWRWNLYNADVNYVTRQVNNTNKFTWTVPVNIRYIKVSYPASSQVKIARSTKDTGWSEAPEDTNKAITTVQTEMEQTAERFSQSIIRVESTLDGKVETKAFNTLQSDVDRTINRIGTAEGRLNTVESTANGTLQTVSGPNGLSTQIATLSDGFSVLSKQTVKNLVPLSEAGNAMSYTWSAGANVTKHGDSNPGFTITQLIDTAIADSSCRIWQSVPMILTKGMVYTIKVVINTDSPYDKEITIGQGNNASNVKKKLSYGVNTISFVLEATNDNTLSIYFHKKGTYRIRSVSVVEGGGASEGQLSVLKDQIDLAVTEGDVVGRINVQAGRNLIQNKQIVMDAETTYFTGKVFIPDAAILELKANKIFGTEGDFVTLRSKVIIANTISAVHLKSDTAMIDKLFATTALIDRLTSKQAFISSIKAIDISADNITTGTLNGAQLNIINMNARAISTGTINGANSSWNLATGRMEFINPATSDIVAFTQGQIIFNRGSQSRQLNYFAEGLELLNGPGNTGTGLNTSLRLSSTGRGSYKYIQFSDPNYQQRILALDNHMYIMPGTGGRVIMQIYNSNVGGSGYAGVEASYYETQHTTGNTIRIIGDRIETPRTGSRDIFLSPNGTGVVRVGNTSGDYYNIRASTFLTSSSRKLKTNIHPTDVDALSIIHGLQVVNYYLIKDLKDGIEHTQIGLIAEDSQIVASLEGDSIDGYKVDAYLIKAVQEVDNKVINLKEHVMSEFERIAYDNLKRDIEIKKLKKRLDLLEGAA